MRLQEFDIGPQDPVYPDPDQRGQENGEWLEEQATRALRRWGYQTWTRVKDTVEEIEVVGKRAPSVIGPDYLIVECKDYDGSGALIGRSIVDRLVAVAKTATDKPNVNPILCHTTGLANTETVKAIEAFGVVSLHVDDLSEFAIAPDSFPPREPRVELDDRRYIRASRVEYDHRTSGEHYRLKETNTEATYRTA